MDPAQEIEVIALARQKSMNDVIDLRNSPVQKFYSGAIVFITGGAGFIGKQLIEKLLRSCDVEKIYLLLRPKKTKTIQERLSYMFRNPVFDSLRAKQPQFEEKIFPIEGDVSEIRLGISENDWIMLKEVNVIIHAAATIRFDEPLRTATVTNIRSVREILQLARSCDKLKKLIHISTAFSSGTEERVGQEIFEQFYPCPVPPDTMIALAENIDENTLNDITNGLIFDWPNTYTFTKCIAEELLRTTAGDLPVCIVRPPIVLPAFSEPAPGWLDITTIYGPSGIYLGGGLGVLPVFCTHKNANLSIAPVDYVNNATIAAGWDSTERQKNGETEIPIYTLAKDLRFGFIKETMYEEKKKLATPKVLYHGRMLLIKNPLLYRIVSFFLMGIPAFILDVICLLIGKKPKGIPSFVDLFKKINKLTEVYTFFTRKSFKFREDNLKAMVNRMNDADKAIYRCNLEEIDLKEYILVWGIGLRKYIVKDGLTGTNKGVRKLQIFSVIDSILMVLIAYFIWWISSSVYFLMARIIF